MKKHSYTALTTFRGWSEYDNDFVYGDFITEHAVAHGMVIETLYILVNFVMYQNHDIYKREPRLIRHKYKVNKDSIGVYTGKDDKKGAPIFCGVEGAKYGGDNMKHPDFQDDAIINIYFSAGVFFGAGWSFDRTDFSEGVVVSTQYEQHLADKEKTK